MTGVPGDPDPYVRFGFTPDEAAGFRAAWTSPYLVDLLDPVATVIHEHGGTPEDCLDYIEHAVEEYEAAILHRHGFNGCQAGAIAHDVTAMINLHERPTAEMHDLLADDGTPRDFIVTVLRVAQSPEETDRLLARYRQTAAGQPSITNGVEDTIDYLSAELALLAMGLPSLSCDCP